MTSNVKQTSSQSNDKKDSQQQYGREGDKGYSDTSNVSNRHDKKLPGDDHESNSFDQKLGGGANDKENNLRGQSDTRTDKDAQDDANRKNKQNILRDHENENEYSDRDVSNSNETNQRSETKGQQHGSTYTEPTRKEGVEYAETVE